MSAADQILENHRSGFRKMVQLAIETVGPHHPAAKLLSMTLSALNHRAPTKRERSLVTAIVLGRDDVPTFEVNPGNRRRVWKTPCIRCQGGASRVLTILLGFPVCHSCHTMFDEGFKNLSSDIDVEFSEPRKLTRDPNPLGISEEEMDIDL